jgi:hypothetical protein
MACVVMQYPPLPHLTPVPWVTPDDCETAEDFVEQVTESSGNFASAAETRAMNFINSVDDGRIIVTPDPIPIWPPL